MIFIVGHPRTGTSVLFKCLQASGYNAGNNLFGHKYLSQDKELNKLRRGVAKGKTVDIGAFWRYVDDNGIEILKDPLLWGVFSDLHGRSARFKKSKFIWTVRDEKTTAWSAVRLQRLRNMPPAPPNPTKTYEGELEFYRRYLRKMTEYREMVDSVVIDFYDLLNETTIVGKVLTLFLGREIDMGYVNPEETFEKTCEPQ